MSDIELQILINEKNTEAIMKAVNDMKQKIIDQQKIIDEQFKEISFYKARLVEVCETCTEKQNCLSFPEYCEGEKKDVICLLNLMSKATEKGKIS